MNQYFNIKTHIFFVFDTPFQNDNKMRVIQSLIIHDVIGRPKIVLDQLREGLQTLGFGTEMKQHPDLFQELFVCDDKKLSGNNVIEILDFPLSMTHNSKSP